MVRKIVRGVTPRSLYEWIVVLLVLPLVAMFGYWGIIDGSPVLSSNAQILTPVVNQGGTFTVRYNIRWRKECRVVGVRFIVDSSGFQHFIQPDDRYVSPDDNPTFDINIPVPIAATPGAATYRATLEYRCNPFQLLFPLKRDVTPKEFTIVAPEPSSRGVTGSLPSQESDRFSMCPLDRPVIVRAHCRARPQTASLSILHLNQ